MITRISKVLKYLKMSNDNTLKEFVIRHIKELILTGKAIQQAGASEESVNPWLEYSSKIVEVCSKDYDSAIHLNYLRLFLFLQTNAIIPASHKLNTCLEYLNTVIELLQKD